MTRIATCPIWIERVAASTETSDHHVEIAWQDLTIQRLWVPRLQVSERFGITKLSARGLPVHSENASDLILYFQACLAGNRGTLPELVLGSRVGAYGRGPDLGWLIGRTWIGEPPTHDLEPRTQRTQLGGAFRSEGAIDTWIEKAQEISTHGPLARWLLSVSFAAPLLRMVGHRTFIVHHWGQSGSGKTALARFAMSVWGHPLDLEQHFNRTEKSFGEIFRVVSDVPVLFDERQASGKSTDFAALIMTICLERGRGRLTRDGELAQVIRDWRSIVRFTGEQPILGNDSIDLGGQANRVLQIEAPVLTSQQAAELNTWCESAGCYGTVGIRFLEGLLEYRNRIAELRQWRDQIQSEISERVSGVQFARIAHLAAIALADGLYRRIVLNPCDAPPEFSQSILDAATVAGMLAQESTRDHGQTALEWLLEHKTAHREKYLDHALDVDAIRLQTGEYRDIVGILNPPKEGEAIWYFPIAIDAELKKAGFNADRVWADLRQHTVKDGRHRKVIRSIRRDGSKGKAYRVYVLLAHL
jgi:uncharacterized protein (DUF927 family)